MLGGGVAHHRRSGWGLCARGTGTACRLASHARMRGGRTTASDMFGGGGGAKSGDLHTAAAWGGPEGVFSRHSFRKPMVVVWGWPACAVVAKTAVARKGEVEVFWALPRSRDCRLPLHL